MKNNPLISVLMTSYNRQDTIASAIESVLNSTFQNFELIIVDDCSSDKTFEIAKTFEETNQRVTVYRNISNQGDYRNRNIAASYAKGEYIKYLDSDDYIYPYSLEIFLDAFNHFPNAGVVFMSDKIQEYRKPFPIEYTPYESFKMHFLGGGLFYASPGGMMISASKFFLLGGFPDTKHTSDFEFLMRVSMKYNIVQINSGLIWWRIHSEQESFAESKNKIYVARRYKLSCRYIAHSPLSRLEKKVALIYQKKKIARLVILQMFSHLKVAYDIYVLSGLSIIELFYAFHVTFDKKHLFKKKSNYE